MSGKRVGMRRAIGSATVVVVIGALLAGTPSLAGAQADVTPPDVAPTVTGTLGSNDWYTSDITISWMVEDLETVEPITEVGCGDSMITADTGGVTVTCEATSDGGTTSVDVTVKRDASAPTASPSASPDAMNGWNNTDVTVSFNGSDATSGIQFCDSDITLTSEGAGQSASGTCTDNAGNTSSSASASNINIDKTEPTLAPVMTPNPVIQGMNATVVGNAADSLSGISIQSCNSPDTSTSGFFFLECSATDQAGNSAAFFLDYEVQAIPTCGGEPATIIGTEGNDVIRGTDGDDVIVGLAGNDVIRGLGGDDIICGYDGRDRLFGGPGVDNINGGLKNDIIKGDQGDDLLFGNQGRDRIKGGSGNDLLVGGSGTKDRLDGRGGFDTCIDGQPATIRTNCEA